MDCDCVCLCTKDVALEWALKECEKDSYPAVILKNFYEMIEKLEKENEELKSNLQKLQNAPTFTAVVATEGGKNVTKIACFPNGQLCLYQFTVEAQEMANELTSRGIDDDFYVTVPCKVVIEE